jgi:hypothetical protein
MKAWHFVQDDDMTGTFDLSFLTKCIIAQALQPVKSMAEARLSR